MDIIFSGDIQRPFQDKNVRLIYDLFSYQIEWLTGKKPIILDKTKTQENWVELNFHAPSWHIENFKNCLWICFEANDNHWKIAKENKIPMIEIRCHPLRFLPTISFAFRSNFCDFNEFKIPEEYIRFSASIFKSGMHYRDEININDNSTIIIGQTEKDRSLIHENKLWSLLDFKNKFQEKIYFKKHPFDLRDSQYVKSISNKIEIIPDHINTYSLLCSEKTKKIMSLSSSCLLEAKYFNKETENLIPVWWDNFTAVDEKNALSFEFWKFILSHFFKTNDSNQNIPKYKDIFRSMSKCKWGYPY